MESIKYLYRIGRGPSSSHTMGPQFAAEKFKSLAPPSKKYRVTLYGSLAATGKGHLTDIVVKDTLAPSKVEFVWKPEESLPLHPNGMIFEAFNSEGNLIKRWEVYSVGGGEIEDRENWDKTSSHIYNLKTMDSILNWCRQNGTQLWEYVEAVEGKDIWPFLEEIWQAMKEAIKKGLKNEGLLPGKLHLARKASSYYIKARNAGPGVKALGRVFAYALAVAEENASGSVIVTAPTCGSSGVVPAVLRYLKEAYGFEKEKILRALATAGLIGNLVKHNASVSGAEVGCQGEIGTACAMASSAAAQLLGGSILQIEYAAELGIEHHLGLTCDPIGGYVQIPCIERNAIAAGRALDCATYALFSDGTHRISFDEVVQTMKETGLDMDTSYKETARSGLARHYLNSEKGEYLKE